MNCLGCGVLIQTADVNASGFIDKKVLEFSPESLCKRCFLIKNYSKDTSYLKDFNPQKEISKIDIRFSIIAVVIDVFNLSEIGRIFKNNKLLLEKNVVWIIINKIDLLPKSTNFKKVRNALINIWRTKFKFNDIIMFSAHKLINADKLLYKLHEAKKNVYLLGSINSGKSSIANAILKAGGASKEELILESHFPHTTLGSLSIPISKKHNLVDLPGLISEEIKSLETNDIKKLNVKGEQKTLTFQLEEGQMLLFDNLVKFNFVSGNQTSFTLYAKNIVKPHRTKIFNKEPKLDFKFKPKTKKKNFRFEFNDLGIKDLEIPSIGFIRFKTSNQVIEIESIFDISIRKTII